MSKVTSWTSVCHKCIYSFFFFFRWQTRYYSSLRKRDLIITPCGSHWYGKVIRFQVLCCGSTLVYVRVRVQNWLLFITARPDRSIPFKENYFNIGFDFPTALEIWVFHFEKLKLHDCMTMNNKRIAVHMSSLVVGTSCDAPSRLVANGLVHYVTSLAMLDSRALDLSKCCTLHYANYWLRVSRWLSVFVRSFACLFKKKCTPDANMIRLHWKAAWR